jgi:hypothetical protein
MRGALLKAVRKLLGHESIEMTLRSSHLTPDVRRATVRLLDQARGIVGGKWKSPMGRSSSTSRSTSLSGADSPPRSRGPAAPRTAAQPSPIVKQCPR